MEIAKTQIKGDMMNILALSGSLKLASTNTKLVHEAARLAPSEVSFTLYEGLASLPHYSPDLDTDDPPADVQTWRTAVRTADAVLISTPEYAYGMPGSLKNALDWTVSSGEFLNKPVAVLSASPSHSGGASAHQSLRLTLTALAASVADSTSLTVPMIGKKLDAAGHIHDLSLQQALRAVIDALVAQAAMISSNVNSG
jgi:NAD(P)H-dependent FMN reductase